MSELSAVFLDVVASLQEKEMRRINMKRMNNEDLIASRLLHKDICWGKLLQTDTIECLSVDSIFVYSKS